LNTDNQSRLGVGVLRDFNKLKSDSQSKNIMAWTPVVADVLEGYCRFDRQDVSTFYFSIDCTLSDEIPVCTILISHLPTRN